MTTDELAALWGAIEPPIAAGMLSGRGVIEAPAGDRAMLAVDHSGLRHLLIPVSDVEAPPKRPATKGLKVDVDVLKVGEDAARRYLDIACRDAAMHGNFVAVALEVIRALEDDATQPAKTVEQILNRWRWFWGSPPAGLSDEGIVGLFGELWYLEFWLAPVTPHVM
ncbi:MAG: PD-(D/E)XK motif protein, partial [bacterium]